MSTVELVVRMVAGLAIAAGLAMVTVTLWLRYRDETAMDTALRAQGHRPPEDDDPDRTGWIPTVPPYPDLDYGTHSRGVVCVRLISYSGRHHLVGVSV